MASYCYNGHSDLTSGELFLWIFVDKALDHLGVDEVAAMVAIAIGQPIVPTRGKFAGATRGTSLASISSRKLLNYEIRTRMLPTITTESAKALRILFTKNIGVFVGRAIPVVGWILLAVDVTIILKATIDAYNVEVTEADKCH
ncbi:STM2901 family protein [Jiella mangrovi]|uniref:STM2901 family protein n=1 Tax=Jiella mangrovi TaxID=2821407 RepID=UPI003CC9147A